MFGNWLDLAVSDVQWACEERDGALTVLRTRRGQGGAPVVLWKWQGTSASLMAEPLFAKAINSPCSASSDRLPVHLSTASAPGTEIPLPPLFQEDLSIRATTHTCGATISCAANAGAALQSVQEGFPFAMVRSFEATATAMLRSLDCSQIQGDAALLDIHSRHTEIFLFGASSFLAHFRISLGAGDIEANPAAWATRILACIRGWLDQIGAAHPDSVYLWDSGDAGLKSQVQNALSLHVAEAPVLAWLGPIPARERIACLLAHEALNEAEDGKSLAEKGIVEWLRLRHEIALSRKATTWVGSVFLILFAGTLAASIAWGTLSFVHRKANSEWHTQEQARLELSRLREEGRGVLAETRGILSNRSRIAPSMLSLAQAIPPGVRLSSWNIEGHRHSVSGEARNVEELSTLVAALQKMPGSPKVRLRTIDRVGTASNAPVHFDIEVSP